MVSLSAAVAFHEARARLQHFEPGRSLLKWTFLLVQSNPTPFVSCRTADDDSGGNKMLVYCVGFPANLDMVAECIEVPLLQAPFRPFWSKILDAMAAQQAEKWHSRSVGTHGLQG